LRRSVMRLNSSVAADRRRCRGMPGRRVKTEILCRTLRFLQGLKTVQEHHEGEAVRYEVPVPERAPHRALGAGGLYVDVRVLLPVPLKPRNLVRRAGGNLSHGSVSLPGKRSTQALPKSDATRRGNQAAVPGERPMPPALLTVPLREGLRDEAPGRQCSAIAVLQGRTGGRQCRKLSTYLLRERCSWQA